MDGPGVSKNAGVDVSDGVGVSVVGGGAGIVCALGIKSSQLITEEAAIQPTLPVLVCPTNHDPSLVRPNGVIPSPCLSVATMS